MTKVEYAEALLDGRWQKKRKLILERDQWTCQWCCATDVRLHVHHRYYKAGCAPWEYPAHALMTVCAVCHPKVAAEERRVEQILIEAIKEFGLDVGGILEIARAFHDGRRVESSINCAMAIADAIETPEILQRLIDEYRKRHPGSLTDLDD